MPKIYEIGIHYVGSMPEEKVGEAFEGLKKTLTDKGAEIINEEMPKLRNLAYTMVKHVAGKNIRYNTAHFGWVKFGLEAENLSEIKESLDHNNEVLRYIVVKTVRENTLHGHKFTEAKKESKKIENVNTPGNGKEINAEVDKAIDNLVTE